MSDPGAYRIVDNADALEAVVDALLDQERYAIDTEFHRERTYYPQLALIQIAWPGDLVLIDPIAVDVEPLAEVFESETLAVLHACSQDLEVLELASGAAPSYIFDTQIAAAFVGMRTPSLASLHDQLLGLKLPKANRLTDWLRRPLEPAQQAYAASDVEHLLEIQDILLDKLGDSGRLGWAEDECELVRAKGLSVRLERRSVSKRDAAAIVEIIAGAKDMEPPPTQQRKGRGGPDLRPAVTLIAAWMSQYADDMKLDPAMLGSRSDIEEFVRSGESRLAHGWRHDLAGAPIRSLLAGEAAVAFDGQGRVIVERRSHEPIVGDTFST